MESLEEHHIVKWVLSELDGMDPGAERFDAKVTVLIENVRHHVEEEEGEFFPKVRDELGRKALGDLGEALEKAKSTAPTHPHPRSPDTPSVVGAIAGVIDRVTDSVSGVAQGSVLAIEDLIATVMRNKKPKASPTGSTVARKRAKAVRKTAAAATDGVAKTARSAGAGAAATTRAAKSGAKGTMTSARKSAAATRTTANAPRRRPPVRPPKSTKATAATAKRSASKTAAAAAAADDSPSATAAQPFAADEKAAGANQRYAGWHARPRRIAGREAVLAAVDRVDDLLALLVDGSAVVPVGCPLSTVLLMLWSKVGRVDLELL